MAGGGGIQGVTEYPNVASGTYSAIGGGQGNTASGGFSTIPGGQFNTALGSYSFAAGRRAKANQPGAFVWADSTDADFASTAANQFAVRATGGVTMSVANGTLQLTPDGSNTPNFIVGGTENFAVSGVYGASIGGGGVKGSIAYANRVGGNYSVVGGGRGNMASGDSAVVAGGFGNQTYATQAAVGGGYGNVASGAYATIGGGSNNTASAITATIGGGERVTVLGAAATAAGGSWISVTGDYAAVGGGNYNAADGNFATIAGGTQNTADGDKSVIGGGHGNTTTDRLDTIGGGFQNTTSNHFTTIPGGREANAFRYGEMAYASGDFAKPGDAQASLYVLRNKTINDSWTDVYLDGISATQRITITINRTVSFDILIVARNDPVSLVPGQSGGYQIQGVIENNNGVTSLVGSPTVTPLGADDANWKVRVQAVDLVGPNDVLAVQVQGANAMIIRWVATARTTEVSW